MLLVFWKLYPSEPDTTKVKKSKMYEKQLMDLNEYNKKLDSLLIKIDTLKNK